METSSPSKPSKLTSDHVNYLIWRYLQERGYGHAAVQLQRHWQSDPQSLSFASDIKPHELISIIQDGLAYNSLQASVQRPESAGAEQNDTPKPPRSFRRYTFIDRKRRSLGENEEGSAFKKQRTNDYPHSIARRRSMRPDGIVSPLAGDGDVMDVDTDAKRGGGSRTASPTNSAMPVDEDADTDVPIVSTLIAGESIGVQCEPLYEPVTPAVLTDLSSPGADITNLNWDVRDPSKLMGTGSNIWRTWTILRDEEDEKESRVEQEDHGVSHISAFGRQVNGTGMALAIDENDERVLLVQSSNREHLDSPSETVLALRWNPQSNLLLGTMIDDESASISSWSISTPPLKMYLETDKPVLDADWVSDNEIIVCGEGFIYIYSLDSNTLQRARTLETNLTFAILKYDPHTRLVACAAPADGTVYILDPHVPIDTTSSEDEERVLGSIPIVHNSLQPGEIAALSYQPYHPPEPSAESPVDPDTSQSLWHATAANPPPRILTTASPDGTITVYNACRGADLDILATFNMPCGAPADALAFSTDGKYITTAGAGVVCVWNAGLMIGKPIAVWPGKGQDLMVNGDVDVDRQEEDPMQILAWNCNDDWLAYGSGDKITVLDMGFLRNREDAPTVHEPGPLLD